MINRTFKDVHFLLLALIFSQTSFIIESIILKTTQQAVPMIMNGLGYLLCFFLFYIGLAIYFKKKNKLTGTTWTHYILGRFLPFLCCFFGIALVYILSSEGYKLYYGLFSAMIKGNIISILVIIGFAVGIAIFVFSLLSFVTLLVSVFQYELCFSRLGFVYLHIIKSMFRKIIITLGITLLLIVAIYLMKLLLSGGSVILTGLYGQGFLKSYLQWFISNLLTALLVAMIFTYSEFILSRVHNKIQEQKEKTSRFPIFASSVIVLALVLNLLFFPMKMNANKIIFAEIESHLQKGDAYGATGLAQKSINEYNLAISKVYTYKGYLQGLIAIQEKEENQAFLYQQALESFSLADMYHPQNPYTPYFRGKIIYGVEENIGGALEQFYTGLSMKLAVDEALFQILYLEDEKENKKGGDKALAALMDLKLFYDPYEKLDHLSGKKIEKYIDELEELEEVIGPKMVYKALEKAKYNDYGGAITDLLALKERFPNDATISYYLAQYYSTYRNENYNYENVKKYTLDFEDLYNEIIDVETEIAKGLFVTQMFLGANDYDKSIETMEALYDENSDNVEVATQYAYLLTELERNDEALEVLMDISKDDQSAAIYYLLAMNYLKKGEFEQSLEDICALEKMTNGKEEYNDELDYYLYLYSLNFSYYWTQVEATSSVDVIKGFPIVYNYLYAVKGWKDKDSEVSNEYIQKVIDENNGLGYAHYIQGINYYEAAVRESTNDFAAAEQAYLRSLEILPNHAEGYFSLAHCYKKAEENLAALRAFRKVVDLLPFEDHRYDPYGMTVHALGEIRELSQYEGSE